MEGSKEYIFKKSNLTSSVIKSKNEQVICGCDFGKEIGLDEFARYLMSTGFQATNVAFAIEEINRMIDWRLSDVPWKETEPEEFKDPDFRSTKKCTIFLAYTSNMISSGLRETIRYLVQNKMVDVLVASAGGVEEDFIKCLAPTYLGDFKLKGQELRTEGINRLGNLLVPNDNYCLFEDWITPILNQMVDEQDSNQGVQWTPSEFIKRLGKEINHPDSVYYWAYKNDIPVFCPALTDGSIGDMLYFFSYKRKLTIDIVQDIRKINDIAVRAHSTGMIILGGGVIKHHTCNANLMRNGAEFAVYVNTGQEFDGSDSGASPDEAVSWGKIKTTAKPVKVSADATLVFPLIVSQTFVKRALSFNRISHSTGERYDEGDDVGKVE